MSFRERKELAKVLEDKEETKKEKCKEKKTSLL
jgi:hypothetical protein